MYHTLYIVCFLVVLVVGITDALLDCRLSKEACLWTAEPCYCSRSGPAVFSHRHTNHLKVVYKENTNAENIISLLILMVSVTVD